MSDVVSSATNRVIKAARQLSTRNGREKSKAFIVEGVRAVEEALRASVTQAILVDHEQADKPSIHSLLRQAKDKKIEVTFIEARLFGSLAETQTPQGVVAIVKDISVDLERAFSLTPEFIVIADSLQDPGNMGTLIRLADAVGAEALVATQGSVDIFNPKVVRASMGSLFHLPIVKDVEGSELVKKLHELSYSIVAADVNGTVDHFDYPFRLPVAVVFGNEGAGLSQEWKTSADLVRIPMPGKAESLNVGVAAGVLLYEIIRQLRI